MSGQNSNSHRAHKKRSLSARQKVFKKHPLAEWWKSGDTGRWIITTGYPDYTRIGSADKLRDAWTVTARNLSL